MRFRWAVAGRGCREAANAEAAMALTLSSARRRDGLEVLLSGSFAPWEYRCCAVAVDGKGCGGEVRRGPLPTFSSELDADVLR
jgi:hypothetical protein